MKFLAWLGGLPVKLKAAFLIAGGAFLLFAGIGIYLRLAENADDKRNQDIGATMEREESLRSTIQHAEEANNAREAIERHGPGGDRLRYDQCLRTARTPTNCQRFLLPD